MFFISVDYWDIPSNYNGIYEVNLVTSGDTPDYNNVYSDMKQDGGVWTVCPLCNLVYFPTFINDYNIGRRTSFGGIQKHLSGKWIW